MSHWQIPCYGIKTTVFTGPNQCAGQDGFDDQTIMGKPQGITFLPMDSCPLQTGALKRPFTKSPTPFLLPADALTIVAARPPSPSAEVHIRGPSPRHLERESGRPPWSSAVRTGLWRRSRVQAFSVFPRAAAARAGNGKIHERPMPGRGLAIEAAAGHGRRAEASRGPQQVGKRLC